MTARSRYAPQSAGTSVKKMMKVPKAKWTNWSTRNAAISVEAVGMEFWNLASRQPPSLMRRVKRLLIMRNAISKKFCFNPHWQHYWYFKIPITFRFVSIRGSCSGETDGCPSRCWDKCQKPHSSVDYSKRSRVHTSKQSKHTHCAYKCRKKDGKMVSCEENATVTNKDGVKKSFLAKCTG